MTIKNLKDTLNYFFYKNAIKNSLGDSQSVLDVGCGSVSVLGQIKGKFISTGIDLFKKSIQISKKAKNHDKYVIGDIRKLSTFFPKKSYDTVIALDVVEHLTKKEAKAMISQMENIAKKRVVILTPNGFYPQDMLEGNPHQVHKSGWSLQDFQSMGYSVYGLRGMKYVRGIHATIFLKPWIVWAFLGFITEPLLYFVPFLSYDLLAIKDVIEHSA